MIKFRTLILIFCLLVVATTTTIFALKSKPKIGVPYVSEIVFETYPPTPNDQFKHCFTILVDKGYEDACFDLKEMANTFIASSPLPIPTHLSTLPPEMLSAKVVIQGEQVLSQDFLPFILSVETRAGRYAFLVHLYKDKTYKVIVDFSKEKELAWLLDKEIVPIYGREGQLMIANKSKGRPEYFNSEALLSDPWVSFIRIPGKESYKYVRSNTEAIERLLVKNGVSDPLSLGIMYTGSLIYKEGKDKGIGPDQPGYETSPRYRIPMDPYTGLPRAVLSYPLSNHSTVKIISPFKEEFNFDFQNGGKSEEMDKYKIEDMQGQLSPEPSLIMKANSECLTSILKPGIQDSWIREVIDTPYGKFSAFGPKKFESFKTYDGLVYRVPYVLGLLDKDIKLCDGQFVESLFDETTCMVGDDLLVNQINTLGQQQNNDCF